MAGGARDKAGTPAPERVGGAGVTGKGGLPIISFADEAAFDRWLAAEPDVAGIWLRIAKAGKDAAPSVTYSQAVDVALCHGWIDGQKAPDDERWWLQRFTPRRARSRWSQVNCDRAERLIESGRMRPAGLAEMELAKADGRWAAAYEGQRTAEVPEDLQAALDADPVAQQAFLGLSRVNRYAILYRIGSVKRAETRAHKITEYVAMLAEGRTLHPQ